LDGIGVVVGVGEKIGYMCAVMGRMCCVMCLLFGSCPMSRSEFDSEPESVLESECGMRSGNAVSDSDSESESLSRDSNGLW
jgi:hypothetical protein